MRKLDRYLIREMLGPFLFGMGAFAVVLVGVDVLYQALEMILEEGLPAGPVLLAALYRLPQTMVMTLPMATVFSSLMAFGGLSSHGEITAMRAGGVGLYRMAAPALGLGLVVSLLSLWLNGWLIPHANQASNQVIAQLKQQDLTKQGSLIIRIPAKGPMQRWVAAESFDTATQTLHKVLIEEYREGVSQGFFAADSAQWQDTTWVLRGARRSQVTPEGVFTVDIGVIRYDIGKSPWELAQVKRKPRDMSMEELRRLGHPPVEGDSQAARDAREEIAMRLAVPWAALGLALIGLPLGIRPQRTSTGIGLGLSLAIILAYYIVISMMRILGQQGALPPLVADWIPNLLLYTVGVGLLVNSSR
jgi:lipopolysaccharide export system permease protein